jgi:hypothetical protein
MYQYSQKSLDKIKTLDPRLQMILHELIKVMDVKIIWGYRGEQEQNSAFDRGNSTKRFPESKHNRMPSRAVDVTPHPVNWEDTNKFYYMDGVIKGIAATRDIKIRGGWDWDGDNDFTDQKLNDLAHFELID